MNIVKLKAPTIQPPKMCCDEDLHKKLNDFELTTYLNSHSTNLLLGKPKSGKSSLMWAMLKNKKLLNGVYHNVYLFQPEHSRASIKGNIFKKHDPSKMFDELTYDNLSEVIQRIKATDSKENNVIIFDDMASYLKSRDTLTSIFFLNQTYYSVPKELRRLFSNIFLFKVSKNEMKNLFDEVVEDDNVKEMMPILSKVVYDKPYQYLFINTDTQKFYKCFDRIDFDEE